MEMFFVAGIGLAAFIEFLLVTKKNKSVPDKVLTLWMFIVTVQLFLFYLFLSGNFQNVPFLLGVERPLPLLHGVMLYFYVSFFTNQAPNNRKLLLLHIVPASLMYLYLIRFFILPPEQKIWVYTHRGAGYELFEVIHHYAIAVSGVCYVIWSSLLLRKHRAAVRDQFSNLERVNLRWLQILTYGMGFIWFVIVFVKEDTFVLAAAVLFVFLIGFFGVRQMEIFVGRPGNKEGEEEEREKYQKSGLTEEASAELHRSLIRIMSEQGLYKESDLSINDLASKLNVHPNYLSQVINQKEQKNFYDFVNGYRVDEFKRLIADRKNEQFTLLALAHDCGFSSKTSFNRCFKKATGQTPSEYAASLAPQNTDTP